MIHHILIVFPVILTTIGCLLIYRKAVTRRQHLTAQLNGVKINNLLKQVLTTVQQHRGMVSAYLNGDASFRYKIAALQAEAGRLLDETEKCIKSLPRHKKHFVEIRAFWDNLFPTVFSMTKQQSFSGHCQLVASILNLIRDIAEQNHLHKESICSFDLAEILWHLLPDTAEAVGQARAIGTGIAASGNSQVTERIKLGFLMTRIRQRIERVDQGMECNHPTQNKLRPTYLQIRGHLDKLIQDVNSQLLISEKPGIDSATFFAKATETLNSVFSVFDYGEQLTHENLQKRMQQAESSVRQSATAAILSLIIVILMPVFNW